MKALIVIDVPIEGDVRSYVADITLKATSEKQPMETIEYKNYVPKPMPKPVNRADMECNDVCKHIECGYLEGWNDCIDEIIGDTE